MDSKKSNKITEIVRLQQILKKWKKLAASAPKVNNAKSTSSSANSNSTNNNGGGGTTTSKSIKFLKRTLSFSESSSSLNNGAVSVGSSDVVPKGYLAVCVGKELKRFIIPMEYLSHQAFGILLREAEEEFGFQQEGVLKIPCQVAVFEKILKMVDEKRDTPDSFHHLHDFGFTTTTTTSAEINMVSNTSTIGYCYSPREPDGELTPSSRANYHQPPQMCR